MNVRRVHKSGKKRYFASKMRHNGKELIQINNSEAVGTVEIRLFRIDWRPGDEMRHGCFSRTFVEIRSNLFGSVGGSDVDADERERNCNDEIPGEKTFHLFKRACAARRTTAD